MTRDPRKSSMLRVLVMLIMAWTAPNVLAAPLPGGTLDPLTIPKYVTPLVIPPVMPTTGAADNYAIAVKQFKQQILPAVDNAGNPLNPTTVWSYGVASDNVPAVAPSPSSTYNYPALTIEATANTPLKVRWVNSLVDNNNNFLPHLLPVDQTVMWANPAATGCTMMPANRTDCATDNVAPYTGPVPMVVHVHGAHVDPHSDGYAFAWWLPAAKNIPAGYSMKGSFFDDATGANPGNLGYADFRYRNDQAAATIWYHDHAMGMTRNNVYAGPAGFWLIRGGAFDGGIDNVTAGKPAAVLPGPAPVAGDALAPLNTEGNALRNSIREIPVAIQDRSFNADGSLFYPASRTFFDGFPGPFVPTSDISPIINVEAMFNTIVVNGNTWPRLKVAPALYRLRLLNGCNSRMLNLSLRNVADNTELPFYQIGAEQGFLPRVVQIKTGFSTPLPGNGTIPVPVANPASSLQALLMGNAERADVIVDFRGLANGTVIRMLNTGADAPFGGFPVFPLADNTTTGQVMQFVLDNSILVARDATTTPPQNLVLNAEAAVGASTATRKVSLNEEESSRVCVLVDTTLVPIADVNGVIRYVYNFAVPPAPGTLAAACTGLAIPAGAPAGATWAPFAPKAPKLGTVNVVNPLAPFGNPLAFEDVSGTSIPKNVVMADNVTVKVVNVTENPSFTGGVAPIEEWEIYNFTMDAHPIHLHQVGFQVINRTAIPGSLLPPSSGLAVQPSETGYKDTVIAYPGEITRVRAKFDIVGLYVWHCHIVEHEDNEMMRPFVVTASAASAVTLNANPAGAQIAGTPAVFTASASGVSGAYQYRFWLRTGNTWAVKKDYTLPGNTWSWDTTGVAPGTYWVAVWARNVGSNANAEVMGTPIPYVVNSANTPAQTVTLSANPAGGQTVGSVASFTATAGGGTAPYQYRFWIRTGATWAVVQDYSDNNVLDWNTTGVTPGTYPVAVWARSAGSIRNYETGSAAMTYRVNAAVAPALTAALTISGPSPIPVGTQILLSASATGGVAPYEYRFWVYRDNSWQILGDYSSTSTFTWNTTGYVSGTYWVAVWARSAGSTQNLEAASAHYQLQLTP